jgi:hypothetical protein
MSNTGRSPIKASNRLQAAAVGGAAVIGLFYYQWRGQQVHQASKEDSSDPARLPTCERLSDHVLSLICVALKLTLVVLNYDRGASHQPSPNSWLNSRSSCYTPLEQLGTEEVAVDPYLSVVYYVYSFHSCIASLQVVDLPIHHHHHISYTSALAVPVHTHLSTDHHHEFPPPRSI